MNTLKRPIDSVQESDIYEPVNKYRCYEERNVFDSVDERIPHEFDFLCDRIIEFSNSKVRRNIISVELAEYSHYFSRLFQYYSEENIVVVPEFLNEPFTNILEFIRYGDTTINNNNVYSLFIASDFLLITKLSAKCLNFIQQNLNDATQVIRLWMTASLLSYPKLQLILFSKVLQMYEAIWPSEEFLHLDFHHVEQILSHDKLNCKSELSVLRSVERWIKVSFSRDVYCLPLFSCARIGLLSSEEKEKARQLDIIRWDLEVQTIFESFFNQAENCNESSDESLVQFNPKFNEERFSKQTLVVFGCVKENGEVKWFPQVYNSRLNNWTTQTKLDDNSAQDENVSTDLISISGLCKTYDCLVVNSRLYAIGGCFLRSIKYLDLENHCSSSLCRLKWTRLSDMIEYRTFVSVAYFDGYIYALGGYNRLKGRVGRLKSAEKYSLDKDEWCDICPMHFKRSDASAAELNGKIYVCGGFDGRRYHDTAEYYDPSNNCWTMIGRMNSPRGGVALLRWADCLYAIGGYDGANNLSTIEKYDEKNDAWMIVSTMSQAGCNLSVCIVNDVIFIIGLKNTGSIKSTEIETFDAESNRCYRMAPLNVPVAHPFGIAIRNYRIN